MGFKQWSFSSLCRFGFVNAVAMLLVVSVVFQISAFGEDPGGQTTSATQVQEVFAELTESLLNHENRLVREAVAQELGSIGGDDAYSALEKAGFLDWPMWQYDAGRSAATPLHLSANLHLQWVRELPAPKRAWPHQWDHDSKLDFDLSYSPVVKGNRIFVPSNVTDSVTAYDIADGTELWRFYANAPVRLAPVAWKDYVYFTADDGHLYCLHVEEGTLVWKFQGGPNQHRLLGNERIINFWAARGGPVVWENTIYFAAGFWPMHGVFIYALNAETGDVVWVNDTTSSDYVELPHSGAYGYGGMAPQGYLAANEDTLVVAGGRTPPAFLDRHTGKVKEAAFRAKPGGGYAVHADGMGMNQNDMLTQSYELIAEQLDGEVYNVIAAHGRLFVTTLQGTLYCFGPEETTPIRYTYRPARLMLRTAAWAQTAQTLLDELGETEGYALLLGQGSGGLLKELLVRSDLHIVVVDNDSVAVRALRDELVAAGVYGRRVAVIEENPETFSVQPYLFSLVASEDATRAGNVQDNEYWASKLNLLRPYGGVAYFGVPADSIAAVAEAAQAANVDKVHVEAVEHAVFAQRGGPLTGAGQWTHQLHDSANTLVSEEQLARLPLGLLWFGGPSNHNILPRHAGGPRPQIAGGRQVYLGVENIAARCVYTGRQLWDMPYPGIGHPFTNMELEERWAEGSHVYMTNIPGATYIGSPFVTLPDSVYLRYHEKIHRLDPATGEMISQFSLPGRSVKALYGEDTPDWGHISVSGDYLISTTEPHIFEDQELGWTESYSGTSSRMLVVINRFTGDVLWTREATVGFRHNAIINSGNTLFVIDGLSENAIEHLARRGEVPEDVARIFALELDTGETLWENTDNVFGTFLLYSKAHDILIESGSQDLRRTIEDEPREMLARRGSTGEMLWERSGSFTVPAAIIGDMLIPGRPGTARSLLTGEDWLRVQPLTGESSGWSFNKAYGCNTLNASKYLLLFRTGYAGYFDLEHDTGTGTFSGFRSGCTANMIAAEGLVNALDYTRTCTCSYQNQTSLAMVHMPGDSNIENWTRYDASTPNPEGYGINLGAPGRRVDHDSGRVWFDEEGTMRRHPSAINKDTDLVAGSIDWVAASGKVMTEEDNSITLYDLVDTTYTVRLHFAELEEDVAVGERVFDVLVNGEEVISNFDILEKTGGVLRSTFEEITVQSDMTMTFEFVKSEDAERDPFINGIELFVNVVEVAAVVD